MKLLCRRWSLLTVAFSRFVLLLLFANCALAQTVTLGTIAGTITDTTNSVVPEAIVAIKDTAVSVLRTTTTNSAGLYVFVNIPPGTYDVTVSKQGFAQTVIPGNVVLVGQIVTRNVVLQIGPETRNIEVATTGVEPQTDSATVGSTVTGIALQSLPSIGRDASTFLTLQPAITPDGSVAGAVLDQNSFQLDGGNNTNDMDGSMSGYTPTYAGDPTAGASAQSFGVRASPTGVMPTPADSVQEFKVSIAGQGADFNSSAGAQVQVVTKRGTDYWHGSAYEYYLNNNWNANTWQNNYVGQPIADYHYNRFGGAIGGPVIAKKVWGGKTYFFANYQGFRWPNSTTIERAVPSEAMKLGLVQMGGQVFNLNPYTVTYNGAQYTPTPCPKSPNGLCDPRAIGINPVVQQMWKQYMPVSNELRCSLARCDGLNVLGFVGTMAIPQNDNFGVARLDHDFGDKWHFMSSYRYYHLQRATTNQVDIGGALPGDTLGIPAARSELPQVPWYFVAGLTTTISNNITNDFRYSYVRNYWGYNTAADPPQLPGLGGALEPLGESSSQSLNPYNVDTQNTRTRFWDGQDQMFRDDVTWLHGRHQIQFGGLYQRNHDIHQRTDNGGGINYQAVYQLSTAGGSYFDMSDYTPAGVPKNQKTNWGRYYAAALGLVSAAQVAHTRSGKDLELNPPMTPALTTVNIPYYNLYASDTWRMSPRFTFTFGLGWTLEMPPYETKGQQVVFVGPDNNPISTTQYMDARRRAALQGEVYNPQIGFALIGNTANPSKYPYNPFYGEWSPRLAAAWDVFGDGGTVLRGGYGRTYGRLNGVALVIMPLLGTGIIQAVQCVGAQMDGTCAGQMGATPRTAFRIGVDGNTAPLPAALPTLPQPLYPGVNGVAAAASSAMDPNLRPNVVDTFTFTFQRQLTNKVSLEAGYIGRLINHEHTGVNLNAVPYMMTKGGQTFAKAYANTVIAYCGNGDVRNMGGSNCIGNAAAVVPQPFFESALSGTGYCNGYSSCTAAVVAREGVNGTGNLSGQFVWSLYSDLDNGGFNFPRSMMNTPLPGQFGAEGQLTSGVGMYSSIGYGNYNALFVNLKTSDWKGLTLQSNFTWSKALGTGAQVQANSYDTPPDPFNLDTGYGFQPFDRRLMFNLFAVYQPSWHKSQSGFIGHLLGGWSIAPIFTTGTGLPIVVATLNYGGQGFGEGDSNGFFGYGYSENAILIKPLPDGSRHNNVWGRNGIATGGYGVNMWADPVAAWNDVRQPILGYDTKDGGYGIARGLNYWNVDLSIRKVFNISERFSAEFQAVFTNVFNHVQFADPGPNPSPNPGGDFLDTSTPEQWGVLPGVAAANPRSMEFGIRLNF